MRNILIAALVSLLTGCATYKPIPEGYSGATANVADSGFTEDGTKAQLYAMTEIDGNRIPNAFGASAGASYGKGFALTAVFPSRDVPIKPMKVKLVASHATGAPIHALFSQAAGTFFSVEGVVDFSPKADGKYVVRGVLKKEGSSVWIEDVDTQKVVTEKIVKN